jgi:hypothetical protein
MFLCPSKWKFKCDRFWPIVFIFAGMGLPRVGRKYVRYPLSYVLAKLVGQWNYSPWRANRPGTAGASPVYLRMI